MFSEIIPSSTVAIAITTVESAVIVGRFDIVLLLPVRLILRRSAIYMWRIIVCRRCKSIR